MCSVRVLEWRTTDGILELRMVAAEHGEERCVCDDRKKSRAEEAGKERRCISLFGGWNLRQGGL